LKHLGLAALAPFKADPSEYYAPHITDKGLLHLSRGCASLTSLDLHGNCDITDQGVHALCAGCPHLRTLNLECCHKLTDVAMCALIKNCKELKTVRPRGYVGGGITVRGGLIPLDRAGIHVDMAGQFRDDVYMPENRCPMCG
jgi:hypothetical protein